MHPDGMTGGKIVNHSRRFTILSRHRLPDNRSPIGNPLSRRLGGARSNVGEDNIASLNEILHTLAKY
jgi:hypothetical protein